MTDQIPVVCFIDKKVVPKPIQIEYTEKLLDVFKWFYEYFSGTDDSELKCKLIEFKKIAGQLYDTYHNSEKVLQKTREIIKKVEEETEGNAEEDEEDEEVEEETEGNEPGSIVDCKVNVQPVVSGNEPISSGKGFVSSGKGFVSSGKGHVSSGKGFVSSGNRPIRSRNRPVSSGKEPISEGQCTKIGDYPATFDVIDDGTLYKIDDYNWIVIREVIIDGEVVSKVGIYHSDRGQVPADRKIALYKCFDNPSDLGRAIQYLHANYPQRGKNTGSVPFGMPTSSVPFDMSPCGYTSGMNFGSGRNSGSNPRGRPNPSHCGGRGKNFGHQ